MQICWWFFAGLQILFCRISNTVLLSNADSAALQIIFYHITKKDYAALIFGAGCDYVFLALKIHMVDFSSTFLQR